MNRKTLLIIAAVFVVILLGAGILYTGLAGKMAPSSLASAVPQTKPTTQDPAESVPQETEPTLTMAPDFTAYDLDGNEVKLSDFFGKPIVLNFWASWCGPCKMEMPDFQKAYEQYGEEVQFLMVNMTGGRETVEKASGFIEKQGFTFPVYYDTAYSAAGTYGVTSLPTTYFLNSEGYLAAQGRGTLSAEVLQSGIDMIYGK